MRKAVVIFLCILLVLSASTAYAADFSDLKGHWSAVYVNALVAKNAIGGFPDGTFKPDITMTRAQFIKILVSALGYNVVPAKSGYWAKPYLDKMIEIGGIEPLEFSNFDVAISRGEMARILIKAITEKRITNGVAVLKSLKDFGAIPLSERYYIANAVGLGLMTGYSDGSFSLSKSATRGEASTVIARVIDVSFRKTVKADVLLTPEQLARHNFKDLPTGYISYQGTVYDVSSASQWFSGSHSGFTAGGSIDDSQAVAHIESKIGSLKVIGKVLTKNFYMDISAQEAFNMLENDDDLVIVDVSPAYAQGHLPGALSMPLGTLKSKLSTLNLEKPILVYCHSDDASQAGAEILIDAGYLPVYRLSGNFSGWQAGGFPVEK